MYIYVFMIYLAHGKDKYYPWDKYRLFTCNPRFKFPSANNYANSI